MTRLNRRLDATLTGQDAEKLYLDLHERVVGQDQAINQIVKVYQMYLAGMGSPNRPIANFLFLGPTGSGKTRLVEACAESLVGDARAMIKIDCAEFQHGHDIAKLIGAPPGYLGHRETHPLLSQEALNQYQTEMVNLSFVLFDEIEKASQALWNLLLGILDKAILTLGDNQRVDFSKTLIFMTSNLGGGEMMKLLRPAFGLAAGELERASAVKLGEKDSERISRIGTEAARRTFDPEFMNRIDEVVVFKPLGPSELRKVLNLELDLLQRRIFDSSTVIPFKFFVSRQAKNFLLYTGTSMEYGARHLKRAINRELVQPLSNLIATQQVQGGDFINIGFDSRANRLTFVKEVEDMPALAIAELTETDDASFNPPQNASAEASLAAAPRPRLHHARRNTRAANP